MSETINKNEQWKLEGICNECRRANYCRTSCTRRKRRLNYEMHSLIADKLNEITGGAYGVIMNNSKI